jgi:hypothetical protein
MPSYGVVQPGMVGVTPEEVKKAMEKVMWWAALGAGLFSPGRGAITKFLTPLLTSDEFCAKVAAMLSRTRVGDKVTYRDLEAA